jgi:hypothetical protein
MMMDVYHTTIHVNEEKVTELFNNTLDGVVADVLYELSTYRLHWDPLMGITDFEIEDVVREAYSQQSTHTKFFFSRKRVINDVHYGWNPRYIVVETMLRIVGS